MMPVGVVLTIAAAGSEGSPNCVLTNEALGIKSGCMHDCIRPKFAVLNPELTYTLPPYQTACGHHRHYHAHPGALLHPRAR